MEAADKKLMKQKDAKKPRMANLELLRCIAMMMVIVLHFLGKGNLLGDVQEASMTAVGFASWVLEALCIVAVNVYMMISGYFLCTSSFKPSRLLQLWLQVWIYSAAAGLIGACTGLVPAEQVDTHYILTLLFPVSMNHYWFMSAYLFLYLLLPFLGKAILQMTEKQMRLGIFFLLFTFCVLKSVLPFRLEKDALGYDCLWYLCVFVTAAYIRRFGIAFLQKKGRALLLYLAGCGALLGELFVLRALYLRTGSLGLILKVSTEYNHLFPFLAATGLFCLFLQVRISGKAAFLVTKIAPYTLGVYLLHENIGLRYAWQSWFGADKVSSIGGLLGATALAAAGVFAAGILADMARALIFRLWGSCMEKLSPGRAVLAGIKRLDGIFT